MNAEQPPKLPAIVTTLTAAMTGIPQIAGILCFGSYALGTQDEQSDIDLMVVCHPKIVKLSIRQEFWAGFEGVQTSVNNPDKGGWDDSWCPQEDQVRLNGLQVEIMYNTLSWLESVVHKVCQGATSIPEIQFRPYTVLGLLQHSIVLYDPGQHLELIRNQMLPFPESLKNTLIAENLAVLHESLAELQNYNQRGIGNRAFHFHFGRILDALELLLFAVNETYPLAAKRVEQALERLPRLPNQFMQRYSRILETPLTANGR